MRSMTKRFACQLPSGSAASIRVAETSGSLAASLRVQWRITLLYEAFESETSSLLKFAAISRNWFRGRLSKHRRRSLGSDDARSRCNAREHVQLHDGKQVRAAGASAASDPGDSERGAARDGRDL